MEEKWFSVAELSNHANVAESTARRYLNKFEKYFQYKKRSKGKKYHPRSVFILEKISMLYAEGYEPEEIEKILFDEFGFAVEEEQSNDELIFSVQFERFK
ncbi:MerR family transcriptional regulator, partial [Oceanobacillus sp. J11TS1]|uniref:MerR family transcriptional regulator n=1 Tax=Oceanobacillus sp. J11TS1 TaxID=2807191 RepID=UPI001BB37A49